MTSITIKEATVSAPEELTDSLGRKLKLRKLDFIQEARLVRMVGEASSNSAYMLGFVSPAVSVASIDGDSVPVPTTERELEGAIKRVGREGVAAVHAHWADEIEKAQDLAKAKEVEQAVKN